MVVAGLQTELGIIAVEGQAEESAREAAPFGGLCRTLGMELAVELRYQLSVGQHWLSMKRGDIVRGTL